MEIQENTESQALDQRSAGPRFLTRTRFGDFELPSEVLSGLKDAGFEYCTPIQAQVLPLSLAGKDVAGQAQTGTGKTAAFLVTVLTRLLREEKKQEKVPSALIVAPTRELALQIYDDARILGAHTDKTVAQVVGGIDYRKQADILRTGPDIVICTPGRIIDYLKQKIFNPQGITTLVIDEADRLFDLGFTKDMRFILRKLPHYEKRQSMLFSATLSYRVLELTYEYMNLPEVISVTPEEVVVEGIEQELYHVGSEEKLRLLLGILKREEWERVLIFANTKAGVEWLSAKLKGNGYPAEGITGDLPQPKRLSLMNRFKGGKVKILVATDVASRGIHVEDISHVINYDIPQDPENYIHRIGRTARAGKTGRALTLACEKYVYHLEPLEDLVGYKIPVVWAEEGWFEEDRAGEVRKRRPARKEKTGGAKKRPGGPSRERPRRSKAAGNGRPVEGTPREVVVDAESLDIEEFEPAPGADASKKTPESQPSRYVPRGVAMSSEPGGIFGLASQTQEQEVKPRKRKRKRKKKSVKSKEENE